MHVDTQPCLLTEKVRKLGCRGLAVLDQHLRTNDGGAHGEKLSANIDDVTQECLLLFQLSLPASHAVKRRASQLAGGPLDETQVPGKRTEFGERIGYGAWPHRKPGQPSAIEAGSFGGGLCLVCEWH